MLRVENLSSGYDKSQILFDVNFEVGAGEVVCLMGRNGMGKTTTVRTLMGLLPAWGGSVHFGGKPIIGMKTQAISRLGLGVVPEGRMIFPNLSVLENLLVAQSQSRSGSAGDDWTVEKVMELFPPLRERQAAAGNLLSGGEQQMLAIGRALMTRPKLLVLDEATEGLAPVVRNQIWDCLARLRGMGQAIVVIDKHLKRLLGIVDTFYVLEKGRTVWKGDADRVRDEEDVVKGYLSA